MGVKRGVAGRSGRGVVRAAVCGLLLAAGLLCPASADGQERETQVALLPERGLVEIDVRLRNRLALFTDQRGFRFARLFRDGAGRHFLEITMQGPDGLVRERTLLDTAALADLRSRLDSAFARTGAATNQDGRTGLILGHTAIGLGYYGWALPTTFDIDDPQGAVATYLLAAGGSFLTPYLLTRNSDVSVAHREAALWGATRGGLVGWWSRRIVGGRIGNEDNRDRLGHGLAVGGSIIGSVLWYQSVDWLGSTDGQVRTRNVMSDFGLAGGFGLAYSLGLFERRREIFGDLVIEGPEETTWESNLFALGVGALGTVGGHMIARDDSYSVGDSHVLRATGVLGGLLGLTAAELVTEDEDKTLTAGATIGAAAGLLLADRVALDARDFTSGQGWLISAGGVAGGLIGLGLGILIDDDGDSDLYLPMISAGALVGYGATYANFAPEAARAVDVGNDDFDVQFNPAGLLTGLLAGNGKGDGSAVASVPILTIRFR